MWRDWEFSWISLSINYSTVITLTWHFLTGLSSVDLLVHQLHSKTARLSSEVEFRVRGWADKKRLLLYEQFSSVPCLIRLSCDYGLCPRSPCPSTQPPSSFVMTLKDFSKFLVPRKWVILPYLTYILLWLLMHGPILSFPIYSMLKYLLFITALLTQGFKLLTNVLSPSVRSTFLSRSLSSSFAFLKTYFSLSQNLFLLIGPCTLNGSPHYKRYRNV